MTTLFRDIRVSKFSTCFFLKEILFLEYLGIYSKFFNCVRKNPAHMTPIYIDILPSRDRFGNFVHRYSDIKNLSYRNSKNGRPEKHRDRMRTELEEIQTIIFNNSSTNRTNMVRCRTHLCYFHSWKVDFRTIASPKNEMN